METSLTFAMRINLGNGREAGEKGIVGRDERDIIFHLQ